MNATKLETATSEQQELSKQLLQESIILEWPKQIALNEEDLEFIEADMAPLIHRARTVIKCRTSHPTMRVKYT